MTNLTQPHRVVFFAICKYFKEGESEEISLKRWLRVVWNLVSGEDENGRAEIRSTSAMRAAIEFIGKIESHNVYESLSKVEVTGNSVFDERCKEEIAKARQILDKNGDLRKYEGRCEPIQGGNFNTWEDAINEAESYAFFKGTIRFLFRDEDGDWNWDDYQKKINRYHKFEIIEVKDEPIRDNEKEVLDIEAREALRLAMHKLPVKTKIIAREKEMDGDTNEG